MSMNQKKAPNWQDKGGKSMSPNPINPSTPASKGGQHGSQPMGTPKTDTDRRTGMSGGHGTQDQRNLGRPGERTDKSKFGKK